MAKNKKKIFRRGDIPLYIMALPGALALLIFAYLPMGGLVIAFKNYNIQKGIFGSDWVGFRNFQFLFSTRDAFTITRNTICYNVVFIIVNMILAVVLALMLSELRSQLAAKFMQTIYMLPHFLSYAVVAIIVNAFLSRNYGLINSVRTNFLGASNLIDWYSKISIWPGLLVFVNAWKGVGYSTVLYLAVISGISQDYYEAAMLDGASRFQRAWYITIPHLRYIISINLIMSIGNIFRGDFGLFYSVTQDNGALYEVTNVLDTYIYHGLTTMSNIGMTTAAGLYQSVVGFILVLIANWIITKIDPESAMF